VAPQEKFATYAPPPAAASPLRLALADKSDSVLGPNDGGFSFALVASEDLDRVERDAVLRDNTNTEVAGMVPIADFRPKRELVVTLPPTVPAGTYTVEFRIFSAAKPAVVHPAAVEIDVRR
jgi:methionine-rich copper-binding protein CopC